jgi:diguanylate cyclase (GGDEF)-like protein
MRLWEPKSLKTSLFAIVATCLIPLCAAAALLIYRSYLEQKAELVKDAVNMARSLAARLDSQLDSIESGLRVLSTSPSLEHSDFAGFHHRASDALRFQLVKNYLLTDSNGQQVINTLRSYGQELPKSGTPEEFASVFSKKVPVLTGLFRGPVSQEPVVAMGVPVFHGSDVVYSLNVGIEPRVIGSIFERNALPEVWTAAVLDTRGVILARNRDAQRFVGQQAVSPLVQAMQAQPEGTLETVTKEGTPVLTAFSRSTRWGWTVAVGAPTGLLLKELVTSILSLSVALVATFAVSIWMALRQARRISGALTSLIGPATQLGEGREIHIPQLPLQELEALAVVMRETGLRLVSAETQALHDALTGLANRTLLEQFARGLIGGSRRRAASLAVLAIDLDGFKQVNDVHGHSVGDAVLVTAAERITSSIRASDLAARLGGDEFVVLLPNAGIAEAVATAQKLIALLSMPYVDASVAISASIGIAASVADMPNEDWPQLLGRADASLYAAKRAGKNGFSVAGE